MNGEWMLFSTIVALLMHGAAATLQRVALLYGSAPIRWIWVGAIVVTVALPAAWLVGSSGNALRSAPAHDAGAAPAMDTPESESNLTLDAEQLTESKLQQRRFDIPGVPPRADRPLALIWYALSAMLLVMSLSTAVRLGWERRRWQPRSVAGQTVFVSADLGPAVVGVLRPRIVLPDWVLNLDEREQLLIVRHEAEHLAARDPALLLATLGLLILTPWNLGLWMQWRGLRRAVEIDCDARVLRHGVERTAYADVLLRASALGHGGRLASIAFAERVTSLSTRIEHLMRPAPRRRAMKTVAGVFTAVGIIALIGAMRAPRQGGALDVSYPPGRGAMEDPYPLVILDGVKRPDLPPRARYVGEVVAETISVPRREIRYRGETVVDAAADKLYPRAEDVSLMQFIAAPTSERHFGPEAKYGAVLYYTKRFRDAGGALLLPAEGDKFTRRADPATSRTAMNDRVFRELFIGISLERASEQRAREVIATEQNAQAGLRGPVLTIWPKRIALSEERNTELRALVSGNDRVTLDARLAERAYRPITSEDVVRNTFASYLSGITFSPGDRSKAEHLIRTFVANEPGAIERAKSDAEAGFFRAVLERDLREYVRSAADRARYDQRLAAMHARTRAVRAVVHLTSVGLVGTKASGDSLASPLLVYAKGSARVAIGGQEPIALTETLRLHQLPAITADVTDGEVHLELTGPGKIEVGGDVTGGPATRLAATGRHIVLLKGGIGIRTMPW